MSNYDYRPDLEELYEAEEVALRKHEELIEKAIKTRKDKEKAEEEENDSDRNDQEAPPC